MLLAFIRKHSFCAYSRQYDQFNLRRYFKNKQQNFKKSFVQIQNLAVSKGLQQPPQSYSKYLLKDHPKILIAGNARNKQFQKRLGFIKQLESKNQMGPVISKIIYENKNILVNMTQNQINQFCQSFISFGFSQNETENFLKTYPKIVNEKLKLHIEQKFRIFKDYLQLSNEDCIKLFVKNGFLIPSSTKRITESIVYLMSLLLKNPKKPFITKQQIINLLFENGQLFLLGRKTIEDTIKTYKFWGMKQPELWPILIKNPVLFNNGPYDVMPLKRKLFRYFRFTTQMGRTMLTRYPLVLLSSVSSLQAKLIFIKQRLKLPVDINILELLSFKFSLIRPRGQLLVRAKANYTVQNIVDSYIRVTDEQLAKKLNISLNRYNEEKSRFKETDELDFRRKKILKNAKIQDKIKHQVNELRQHF